MYCADVCGIGQQLQDRTPGLERSRLGHTEHLGGDRPDLRRRPDVVATLLALTVGIQRRREAALGGEQIGEHPVAGLDGDPPGQQGSGQPPPVRIHAREQSVVVQHLLEVRDDPVCVDGVAGEAAAELVVDAAAGHPLAGDRHDLVAARRTGPRGVPQQELQDHRRWELRGAAEPSGRVDVPLPELARRCIEGRRGDAGSRQRRRRALRQLAHDRCPRLLDLGSSRGPRIDDRLEHTPKRRHAGPVQRGEVGATEDRLAGRRQDAGHRPATRAGQRLGRLHVHRVDIRSLLAINLDADELLVEISRDRLILERLVRHDVAPVTSGVAHAQQDRDLALPGGLERLLRPRPPVDGVVLVLQQVGTGGGREAVRHLVTLSSCRRGGCGGQVVHRGAADGGSGEVRLDPLRDRA